MQPFATLSLVIALTVVHGGLAPASRAQETPPTQELRLPALGGAALQVPSWKEVRKDQAVAVYEQLPEPAAQKPYYVLLCALEEGPAKGTPVPWDKVRDNIVQAASKNGRTLTLEVKDPFAGAATFEGRHLVGEFQSGTPGKKVGLELLALVKDGKLLTIGLVAETLGPATAELVESVAKSAHLGP